jgi:hypothetical protein
VPDNPSYIHKLEGILEEARAPKPISFFRSPRHRGPLWPEEASGGEPHAPHRGRPRQPGARRRPARPYPLAGTNDRKPVRRRRVASTERVIGRIVELKAETAARAVKIVFPHQKPSVLLPDGVSLEPGLLTVVFEDDQQLLQRLFLLARVLADEPEMLTRMNQPPVN